MEGVRTLSQTGPGAVAVAGRGSCGGTTSCTRAALQRWMAVVSQAAGGRWIWEKEGGEGRQRGKATLAFIGLVTRAPPWGTTRQQRLGGEEKVTITWTLTPPQMTSPLTPALAAALTAACHPAVPTPPQSSPRCPSLRPPPL